MRLTAESWAWTSLGVEEQLLIFSPCLSPGRVKKLQKLINFFLKVGLNANLKLSQSTWRHTCDSCEMYKISTSRNGNDLQQLFFFILFFFFLFILFFYFFIYFFFYFFLTPVKCTKSAHHGMVMIYNSCFFDIRCFRAEPTDLRQVSTVVHTKNCNYFSRTFQGTR